MIGLPFSGMFSGNGSAAIVHFEKNLQNLNRQDSFLYLWQVLECLYSWYVVMNLYSSGCSASSGRATCITLTTSAVYSSLLSLVKVSALTTKRNK